MQQQTKLRRALLKTIVAGTAAFAMGGAAFAQDDNYPNRTVTIVLGFSAGGPTDVVARILADKLSNKFGQTFVVDNKAGASGTVAANYVKKAKPDGYTLMLGSSSTLSIVPNLRKDVQYDPIKDFTAIALVANYPYFLVTPGTSQFNSYDELVEHGKSPSAQLTYASAGTGAVNHLAGEWFKSETKINATHIPYKGDSAAISDLIAGRVDFAFLAGAAVLPHMETKRLKILASASSVPGRGGDNVLTIGEDRIKGFSAEPWNGLMGPAGVPDSIVKKLNAAVNEAMQDPEVTAKLASMEQYAFTGTPQYFTDYIAEQTQRWAKIVADANISVDK
ncbi:MAG TPA: tripartite tricarboxylate transporter substrate binding protein [Burkholderiaceae bacterium]|jgi:tripartite-type tricarboxylate transporter receptor subunit TctC|nr:tripartite tricarboxylate transporter substrate binding protein [Burkholderiaceae bacterium]